VASYASEQGCTDAARTRPDACLESLFEEAADVLDQLDKQALLRRSFSAPRPGLIIVGLQSWFWLMRRRLMPTPELRAIRSRRSPTIYIAGRGAYDDTIVKPLAAALERRGIASYWRRIHDGYDRFSAELDACSALVVVVDQAWASTHESSIGVARALGLSSGGLGMRPAKPTPKPIFVIFAEPAPGYLDFLIREHAHLITHLSLNPADAANQIAVSMPHASPY
jgi:hypothetical protein